jgi:hypothetical protein
VLHKKYVMTSLELLCLIPSNDALISEHALGVPWPAVLQPSTNHPDIPTLVTLKPSFSSPVLSQINRISFISRDSRSTDESYEALRQHRGPAASEDIPVVFDKIAPTWMLPGISSLSTSISNNRLSEAVSRLMGW